MRFLCEQFPKDLRASLRGPVASSLLMVAIFIGDVNTRTLRAQPSEPPKKEISEKVSSELGSLRTFIDAKNYTGALSLVERLIPISAPESFDLFVLSQIQAQILLTQGKLIAAITPLETAYNLTAKFPFFSDTAANLEQSYILAQLYYQRGEESKVPEARVTDLKRALAMIRFWLERSPKATNETRLFAASLLYSLGTLDPQKPDSSLINQAIEQAEQGLLISLKPSPQLYQILLACHQQLGDLTRAAELLEILAERPDSTASSWQQLQSLYLAAASESKDPNTSARLNLRALLTIERAQARGFLNTPKDRYTYVAILFNIQQFTRAAALIEKGLADGTLENQKRNWDLLASAYQQTNRDDKAIATIERALKTFPTDSALQFNLAQFYYNAGRVAEAYDTAQSARSQPAVEKPGQISLYLAYLAYELQRYEDAARWIEDARPLPGVSPEAIEPLFKAVTEAQRERDALKAAKS